LNTNTQQLIIIILGIIAVGAVITQNNTILDVIVAGLIGFLSQKTLTEKQSEIIEQQTLEEE